MFKKLNSILNIVMGSFVGVTVGHSISQYINYRKYADLYAMQSVPWYTSVLLYCGFTGVVLLICIVVKIIIKRKNAKK